MPDAFCPTLTGSGSSHRLVVHVRPIGLRWSGLIPSNSLGHSMSVVDLHGPADLFVKHVQYYSVPASFGFFFSGRDKVSFWFLDS